MSRKKITENESVEELESTSETKPAQRKEAVIYIGETLSNGVLQQHSIFINGVPSFLNEHVEACPAIRQLMVPISRFAESKARLAEQGSLEYQLNAEILKYRSVR